jgi:uroporphyrinogen-III synthase
LKRVLYLGTDPSSYQSSSCLVHYPVIQLIPKAIPQNIIKKMADFTHLIFTSKNAVSIFFKNVGKLDLSKKIVIAVGKKTAERLAQHGHTSSYTALEETQEGVIALLLTLHLEDSYILLPQSSQARPNLKNFLKARGIAYQACILYDTISFKLEPVPNLNEIEEIVFTSPSTVKAFIEIFKTFPVEKKLTCIGPITRNALKQHIGELHDT